MNSQHLIQKQFLEIEFDNHEDALGLQKEVAEVFYEKVQPCMEELFEGLFGKDYFVAIDKLEIDCGILNRKNWEQDLTECAMRLLKEELIQLNRKHIHFGGVEKEIAQRDFFFFLENGFFPWNVRHNSLALLEKHLIINEVFLTLFKKVIKNNVVAERFANQFSKKFITEIIRMLSMNYFKHPDSIHGIRQKFITLGHIEKNIDLAILKFLAEVSGQSETSDMIQFEKEVETILIKESKSKSKESQEEIIEVLTELYINNAGLVILHPYITRLFEELKFTSEDKWVDELSLHHAVAALEFLATGKENFGEFDLPLNKILCGINPNNVVNLPVRIDTKIVIECESLLEHVIEHWSTLKNTSIDGLREAFVMRNGCLTRVNHGWLLKVEPKGVDMLLSHLPWGTGPVKLPWMDEILFVEWTR